MTDAVVCARGERARTFVPVVRALRKGTRGRVIVVDDGGNRGVWRARLAGARVVEGPQQGKAAAMRAGLEHVTSERVVFADADLTGFSKSHARRLARPCRGMVCGLRPNGSALLGPVPAVTGERCLPRDVACAALASARGYDAELALDAEVGKRGLPVVTFTMVGVVNPPKEPFRRAGQVLRAVPRYLLGLAQYMTAWIITAIGALVWN